MDEQTIEKLVALNREFYQTFAAKFSATRKRIQPGVKKILENTPLNANILDLGCGNGEFAHVLAVNGHCGFYLGLDFSYELLEIARERLTNRHQFSFFQGDLGMVDWHKQVRFPPGDKCEFGKLDTILAFATLHHLPGHQLHVQTCLKINRLLESGGHFIHSNWQFLNSDRLRKRIQPWTEIDLDAGDVDPGDYLMDWRLGGRGLRYVHHFHQDELSSLASQTGFELVDSFLSDGDGGNLGLYQIWEKTIDMV